MNTLETIVGLNTVCAGPTPAPTLREPKKSWNLGPSPSFQDFLNSVPPDFRGPPGVWPFGPNGPPPPFPGNGPPPQFPGPPPLMNLNSLPPASPPTPSLPSPQEGHIFGYHGDEW